MTIILNGNNYNQNQSWLWGRQIGDKNKKLKVHAIHEVLYVSS